MTSATPTSQNRATFKNLLRENKDLFSSPLLHSRFGEISAMLDSHHNSLTASDEINVVLFDYNETVDISNATDLIYLPAQENDVVNLQNGSTTKSVKVLSTGVEVNSTSYGLGSAFVLGDRKFTVYGLGGALLNGEDSSTYTLTPSTTAVNEGDTITFTLTTTNVPDGTMVNYSAFLDEVDAADFTPNGAETGSFTVTNNTGTFNLTISEDYSPQGHEGTETFIVNIEDPSDNTVLASSPSITITDSSFATFSVSGAVASAPITSGIITKLLHQANGQGYNVGDQVTLEKSHLTPGTPGTGALIEVTEVDDGATGGVGGVTKFKIISGGQDFEVGDTSNSNDYWKAVGPATHSGQNSKTFRVWVTEVASAISENDTVTYTVDTTNVPDGQILYWKIVSGTGVNVSASSGNFTINNNQGTFDLTCPQDLTDSTTTASQEGDDDGTEAVYGSNLITIELYPDIANQIVVASISTTVFNTPFTITLTPNATSVNESSATQDSTVVFDVQTTGIPDGQVLSARIAGGSELTFGGTGAVWTDTSGPPGIDGGDFPSQQGSSTINSNTGVLTVPINRDGRTEGDETFRIEITNSAGNVVATSPDITINDTSYVGLNKDNKTFGPIHVIRDGGDVNNTSDWYNICGLDAVPDGAKIAIFVDGSGSMTMGTVQASYDKLAAKLNERGISFITVTNSNEDWITPFDVELN